MAIEAANPSPMNLSATLGASLRPLLLMVGMAAAVAVGVAITLWSQGPTYGLLYGSLADTDAAAVTRSLASAGIDYRLDEGNGGISVPAAQLNEARMLLAEQGVLDSGGFANLAKENGLGISTFMESARYQYALEMELSKTISSMQHVASARVHIAAPRQSSFVRDRTPARASVFLQLRAGRRLSGEQVSSIVNLVGSSVPDMDPSQVTVIDQQGRLLSAPEGRGEDALRDQQLDYAREVEENFAQRIEALITPIVGIGRVRAEVSADFDMTASEEAREQFSPEGVVRSEQVAEERGVGGARGVPGAAANQVQNAAAGAGVVGDESARSGPSSVQSTRNYELNRTVSYTRQMGGQLTRLSVAVLVDNAQVPAPDGTLTDTPLTPEQIERITQLVKDAVGFNEERGDRVSVVNAPWRDAPIEDTADMASTPIWERAWFLDALKAIGGLVALLVLILTVIRPMVQRFNALLPAAAPQPDVTFAPTRLPVPTTESGALAAAGAESASSSGSASEPRPRIPTRYDEQIDLARSLVNEDPARVAQVVKKWAMNNG
jgi:flagellar M-ring protein FliF